MMLEITEDEGKSVCLLVVGRARLRIISTPVSMVTPSGHFQVLL